MNSTGATTKDRQENELQERRWSVVSFDKCEASSLTYFEAAQKLADLEAAKVPGLCLVTDEAAERMCDRNS